MPPGLYSRFCFAVVVRSSERTEEFAWNGTSLTGAKYRISGEERRGEAIETLTMMVDVRWKLRGSLYDRMYDV